MKLIIAGGRDYKPKANDMARLDALRAELGVTEVVSGCATGADAFGEEWAAYRGIPVKPFWAPWTRMGKPAGRFRNVQMAHYADACVVFPGDDGTDHMWRTAKRLGLRVFDWRKV